MELIDHLIYPVEKRDRKTSLALIDEWIRTLLLDPLYVTIFCMVPEKLELSGN